MEHLPKRPSQKRVQKSTNCIARNVLRGGAGPMALSPALARLGNTEALAELIESEK
jgi:hypothetical protein